MGIEESITRTLQRIGAVSEILNGPTIRSLYTGIAQEFGRVKSYIDKVLCAAVPSSQLCTEALDDLEDKYGITYFGDVTTQERINRIIERASLYGAGGAEWLEDRIQEAGFPLYVIENVPGIAETTQFGDVQFDETTQFSLMPNRIDPSTVPGYLITSSAAMRSGGVTASSSQFGVLNQFGSTQFGTPDERFSYPQPADRQLPTNPQLWGRVFFLSPFPDRLATENELLYLSSEQLKYLERLIIQIKYLRNWCIAQVAELVVFTTEDGVDAFTTEDGIDVIKG